MKVFMDTAEEYPRVKIIAIGAVDSAREVIQYDREMSNRVAEIEVPLMDKDELRRIISLGESRLNVNFGQFKNKISTYSSGLPAVCHQLALNICFEAGIEVSLNNERSISKKEVEAGIQRYLDDASDTLKDVFETVLKQDRKRKFSNTELIIDAMANIGSEGASHSDLLAYIKKKEPSYPPGNLTAYLKELKSIRRRNILRFNSNSKKYFFSDPLYLVYAQCLHNKSILNNGESLNIRISIRKSLEERIISIFEKHKFGDSCIIQ